MKLHDKETAYDMIVKQLALCTVENAHHEAVIVLLNNDSGTVRVYGLNIDEFEVPQLLLETAAEVSETIDNILKERTVQ